MAGRCAGRVPAESPPWRVDPGDAAFDSILAGVAEAKNYVLFQFYMFHDDGAGKLADFHLDELHQAGAQVSSFKPVREQRNALGQAIFPGARACHMAG